MIVLGACWAWNPPQHVLGLKAQVLVRCIVKLSELWAQSVKYRLSHRVVYPKFCNVI